LDSLNYVSRYRKDGHQAFLRRPAADPSPRIRDEALAERVLELVREKPWRTVPAVRRLLSADSRFHDAITRVSNRTLYRFLDEHGLSLDSRRMLLRDEKKTSYRRFEAPRSLALVQGDARDGIWLTGPDNVKRKTYLFAWLDDYSRKLLYAQYYFDEKLPRLEDSFRHMVLRWGIPEKVYLDNGSVYVSHQFAWILAELAIKKIHHPPYQAHCKGKIESMNKTIESEFQSEAQHAGFTTLDELNTALWAWIDLEYNARVHSSTGQAPDKRFAEGLPSDHRRVTDIEWFEALFLMRETRTVTKYGMLKLLGNEYRIISAPHGASVEVRFNPFDLSRLYVFERGKCIETIEPKRMKNRVAPRIPEEKKSSPAATTAGAQWFETLRRKHLEMMRERTSAIPYAKLSAHPPKKEDNT
jgi:transposase InsO family protein